MARRRRRVLVVDDDDLIRRLLIEILTDEGYHVRLAVDGRAGLALLRDRRPDAVVLEAELPDLDPPTFRAAGRRVPGGADVPVLLVGALGLVVNAVVLWNTRYVQRVLDRLDEHGAEVRPEDVERLSPLGFGHVNLLGRCSFQLAEPLTRGELRSLRDPADPEEQDVPPA